MLQVRSLERVDPSGQNAVLQASKQRFNHIFSLLEQRLSEAVFETAPTRPQQRRQHRERHRNARRAKEPSSGKSAAVFRHTGLRCERSEVMGVTTAKRTKSKIGAVPEVAVLCSVKDSAFPSHLERLREAY